MSLEVAVETQDQLVIVDAKGRLDGATAPELESRLSDAVAGHDKIVIDMSGLGYVSSAGLRILLKAAKQAKARSARLALCGLQPNVQEVFDISGFSTIFTITDSRSASIAAVS